MKWNGLCNGGGLPGEVRMSGGKEERLCSIEWQGAMTEMEDGGGVGL